MPVLEGSLESVLKNSSSSWLKPPLSPNTSPPLEEREEAVSFFGEESCEAEDVELSLVELLLSVSVGAGVVTLPIVALLRDPGLSVVASAAFIVGVDLLITSWLVSSSSEDAGSLVLLLGLSVPLFVSSEG